MTPGETIVANANRTFEVQDRLGRRLLVRQLNALDRLRLLKAAGPELSHNEPWLNMAALAASVVEVNGIPRPTPVNERQLESAVLELGDHGLDAVAEVLQQHDETTELLQGSSEGNAAGTPS